MDINSLLEGLLDPVSAARPVFSGDGEGEALSAPDKSLMPRSAKNGNKAPGTTAAAAMW